MFIIGALVSCSRSSETASCTASVVSTDTEVTSTVGQPFTSGILTITNSKGEQKWCNATVALTKESSKYLGSIFTAKHCLNPFDVKNVSLKISNSSGFVDVGLSSKYLDKVKFINSHISDPSFVLNYGYFDYSKTYDPSFLGSAYETLAMESLGIVPAQLRKVSSEIKKEQELNSGKILCDSFVVNPSVPNKACFTYDDFIAFEAELTFEVEDTESADKAVENALKYETEVGGFFKNIYLDRSSYELELFQHDLWFNLLQCSEGAGFGDKSSVACTKYKTHLEGMVEASEFYKDNFFLTENFKDMSTDDKKEIWKNILVMYLGSVDRLSRLLKSDVSSSLDTVVMMNNVVTKTGDLKTAFIDFKKVIKGTPEPKVYGVVVSMDPEMIKIFKGDSGSVLLYGGIPFAALSTYEGEPISSGLASALPAVSAEDIPEVTSPSLETAEGEGSVDVVDIAELVVGSTGAISSDEGKPVFPSNVPVPNAPSEGSPNILVDVERPRSEVQSCL
ncbi:hypothetical protein N9W79_01785 [bacterium]|nr:hypothetical protein [bacterium]